MFDKLKKALFRGPKEDFASPQSQMPQGPVSEWAATRGFMVSMLDPGTIKMQGKVSGKPWAMELGTPSRRYIRGEELRARAELGLSEEIAVLIMNRPLKEALERKAYSMITDDLQTQADPNLPEEMRWLAMYEEVGWESLPTPFWDRYSILADQRENALAWVDTQLAQQMLDWPEVGPSAEIPFIMLLLRGKAYLRMEYAPATMPVLQHAASIFTSACESAIGSLSTDIRL